MVSKQPTVFLDRDGTVIVDCHYLSHPSQVILLPGAVQGLRQLRDLGFQLVLITNQSGVSRGYFSVERVQEVHDHLGAILAEHGIEFDGIFFCPHHPDDNCHCRKPQPGLIEQACAALPIDLDRSVVIGDKLSDVAAGVACGIPGILIAEEPDLADDEPIKPDVVVPDLPAAADWISRLYPLSGNTDDDRRDRSR